MLQLFYSNRYETLSAALLADLAAQRADVWRAPPVIVPSAAVRRRLQLDIAASQSVCANIEFSYLAPWLWAQIARVMPVPSVLPFTPERLVWRCYRLLGAPQGKDAPWRASPRLSAWLDAADDAMHYELAQRVAQLFDHYLTYRPGWLMRWQAGESIAPALAAHASPAAQKDARWQEDERWQSALWRALLGEVAHDAPGQPHQPPVYRFLDLVRTLDQDAVARAGWPESVSVFALPTMPPLHVALLREISRWIDVRVYALNPCREFWFDIVSEAQLEKLQAAGKSDYQEVGHPLLAEWGKQAQAQLRMLHELTELAASRETSAWLRNDAPTWLARIQNAILDLRDETHGQATAQPALQHAGIEVHVCHSLMRQLEVLHDQLLDWFNREPELQPADVLVVLPDLVSAAPLIDAVFGARAGLHHDARRIPYRITNLPPSHANPVARALLDWLALPTRCVSAPELVEWLRVDAIAARFHIDAAALDTVQAWLAAAGARRGLAPIDMPGAAAPVARHTFSDALTRLFLGYALPSDGEPVDAWLPVEGARGSQAQGLGMLAYFIDALEEFAKAASVAHTPDEWRALWHDMLAQCFDAGAAFADWLADTRDAIDSLVEAMRDGAPNTPVPAAVMRNALTGVLDDPARGGVPWGGVTFSSLGSLRGLPYRAVCVLGMDDKVLPSTQTADEFDLMARFPQPGDRQRRDDERNLFLDLLLAARDKLLIAYTGRSQRDNAALLPAALVDELLDHLAQLSCGPDASPQELDEARRAFIVEHPLQSFSAQYFSGNDKQHGQNPLFTYEPMRAELAQHLAAPRREAPPPFFAAPLPRETDTQVMLDDFLRFWRHPARALLRERLDIVLENAQSELSDIEPFVLDYHGGDAFADRLLPIMLDTSHDARDDVARRERVQRIAAASPELPEGATGQEWCRQELDALYDMVQRVQCEIDDAYSDDDASCPAQLQCLPFSLTVSPRWPGCSGNDADADAAVTLFEEPEYDALLRADIEAQPVLLTGTLNRLTPAGQILFRYAKPTGRDCLAAWISHLVYCAVQPEGPRRTVWHGRGASFAFTPVEDAQEQLARLMALYLAGRRMPLRLFPRSAGAKVLKLDNVNWETTDYSHGESDDPALRIAFRGAWPLELDETFDALAQYVFGPMKNHLHSQDAQ